MVCVHMCVCVCGGGGGHSGSRPSGGVSGWVGVEDVIQPLHPLGREGGRLGGWGRCHSASRPSSEQVIASRCLNCCRFCSSNRANLEGTEGHASFRRLQCRSGNLGGRRPHTHMTPTSTPTHTHNLAPHPKHSTPYNHTLRLRPTPYTLSLHYLLHPRP